MSHPHPLKGAPGPREASRRSENPLWILLVASLVLPVIVFAIAARLSYQAQFDQARDRIQRTVGVLSEHAVKVFDTFEISERYMEELFESVTDDEIEAREAAFSARLAGFIENLPQLRDLWVIDGDGRPLVSGTIHPMPKNLNLADREYFSAHKSGNEDTYVSEVVDARAADTNFFAITRKRTLAGKFAGIYLVSIAPEYFTTSYERLLTADTSSAALLRADGAVLARYPETGQQRRRVSTGALFMEAAKQNPEVGITRGVSPFDGIERLVAYRRLPRYNVYVVAGTEVRLVHAAWLKTVMSHLFFGVPATIMMFSLALMALTRTRREAQTFAQLQDETSRRHAAEMELRQAQKMEAVGQLTGGVAHDFNNLLTIISGNLETLRRRLGQAKFADATHDLMNSLVAPLDRAQAGAHSAAQLTHRLLAFSRRQALKPERVDLNNMVTGLSDLLARTLGESVNIETVLAAGLWPTSVDRNQFENVILNLAINARDAMPNGGPLTIETANSYLDQAYVSRFGDVSPGQYVMLSVTDSGTGIPPEILDKVFEPFFTTKPVGQGSGLGLAMVHGFVKQSGGHVRIYSEAGVGTTVKIYLPRLTKAEEAPSVPSGKSDPAAVMSDRQPSETILVVEDNEGVREFATATLGELGYRVLSARDGDEALRVAEENPNIDLLFTDVVLPGAMNGRELANKILARRPEMIVLFTTGYTRNAIIHHGRLDADVQLLVKPYSREELTKKMSELLEPRRSST